MLDIIEINKHYNQEPLLTDLTLKINQNEIACLLGPSGSGKSTLLRIIAGLEQQESGHVYWEGEEISQLAPHLRHFGLMFQDYALFPHLTVGQNVAFGLEMQSADNASIETKVRESLSLVNMIQFIDRSVVELSGGEQQRVALARAIAPQPRLLMLDEPLGAMDRNLQEQLLNDLRMLMKKLRLPVLYVTHDQEEAFSIADRVMLLHDGRIIQDGDPFSLYMNPKTLWVASFLGLKNQLKGEVVSDQPLKIHTALGDFQCPNQKKKYRTSQKITLVFQPLGGVINQPDLSTNLIRGRVVDEVFRGESFLVKVEFDKAHTFTFHASRKYNEGDVVEVGLKPEAILCFDED
jgi:spermidine/putrescine transport system ATP-binding protein